MGFIDEIGRKVTNAGQQNIQVVKDFSEKTKINTLISDEEKKIKNACYEIGKIYMSLHKQDFEQDFAVWMGIVNEAEQKIEDYKRQIGAMKSVKRCSCGAELIEGMAFCAVCGKPVQKQEPMDEIKCIHCGKPLKKNVKFCIHCGTPIDQSQIGEQPELPPADERKEQICSVCGAKQSLESIFCTECGNRMKEYSEVTGTEKEEPRCPTCVEVLLDGVNFCVHCGTPIIMPGKDIDDIDVYIGSERKVCPKCGAEVEEKDLFCINCGENLVQQGENKSENICPNCGEILEGHPEYCTRCGMRLIIKN